MALTPLLTGCIRIEFEVPAPTTEAPPITLEGSAEDTYDLSSDAALEEGTAGANTVLELVNRVRIQEGLEPLTINLQLNKAAQAQADHQASILEMTHDGLGGLGERVSATGYQWRMVAENVAFGQFSYTQVMTGWVDSPGHYANIVNPKLEEMGFAMTYGSDGRTYFAQVFGSRLP
ncbi:CAP domain-containing protein [Gulosibacter molinativorax]|uniref:CAP domain-containing protein n=1 Tax=Gulosibacter molinativorax TaxID=256821 RepID=UPI0006872EEB|nr:CAP domain-containing protein [Gulosibacter molinativorax]